MLARLQQGLKFILCGLILCSLFACSSKSSTFYVLTPLHHSVGGRYKSCDITVGVGPLHLPRYLQQPQIVLRTARNSVSLSEFNRWAEPLDANIKRVLEINLGRLLPVKQVVVYPWSSSDKVKYQVKVSIGEFDTTSAGQSRLIATWYLYNEKGDLLTRSTRSYVTRVNPSAGPQYQHIVEAMNRNLTSLSQQIARDLRRRIHC